MQQQQPPMRRTGSAVERVRVHCRVRPVNDDERRAGYRESVKRMVAGDDGQGDHIAMHYRGDERKFKFDTCFGAAVQQDSVYDVVAAPTVASVMEGYNGTIFAYGQTGSGKTHSMFGQRTSQFIDKAEEQDFQLNSSNGSNGSSTGGSGVPPQYPLDTRAEGPLLSNTSAAVAAANAYTDSRRRMPNNNDAGPSVSSAGSSPQHGVFEDGAERGIVPRALEHMFQIAAQDSEHDYQFAISYVQIYCEIISDLLVPENTNLSIREDYRTTGGHANPRGVYIEGSASFSINSQQQAMEIIRSGDENRHLAATRMNATSSRSHACMIVTVEKRSKQVHGANGGGASGGPAASQESRPSMLFGKLILVDLAGSERVKKALGGKHPNGTRFAESKAINLSLSALGNCISALATKKKHVPYRDAKLTRLLQDSLGGNCKTSLILNVGPCDVHESETYSSLLFGQRAMAVETRVHLNEEVDYKVLYTRVQKILDKKDDEIHGWEIKYEQSQRALAKAKALQAQAEQERDKCRLQLSNTRESTEAELNALRAILEESGIHVREVAGEQSLDGGEGGADVADCDTSAKDSQTRIIAGKIVTMRTKQSSESHSPAVGGGGNSSSSGCASEAALASLKSQWEQELSAAESAHAKALAKAKKEASVEIRRLTEQCQVLTEEWNRLESELKGEKEEHLEACQLLHAKQKQLAELEMSTGERVAELLEECNDRNDQIKTLEMKVEAALKDRKQLANASEDDQVAVARLKTELQKSHEYQARTLQLMDTLTARVEHLEAKRSDSASLGSARSFRSTGRQEYGASSSSAHAAANTRAHKLRMARASAQGSYGGSSSISSSGRRGGGGERANGSGSGSGGVGVGGGRGSSEEHPRRAGGPQQQQQQQWGGRQEGSILKSSAVQRSRSTRTTAASILGDFGNNNNNNNNNNNSNDNNDNNPFLAGLLGGDASSIEGRLQALREGQTSSRWR